MFSGSNLPRPSFNIRLDRPVSSRGRSEPASTFKKASSGKVKDGGGATTREIASAENASRPMNTSAGTPAPFMTKGGKKHHALSSEEAPYPFSYDPKILALDVLDHIFIMQSRKTVTWLDFKGNPPKRSLDLGCGTGAWILDAAKEWKDCHFVGFDLVAVQPEHKLLPPEVGNRIKWVYGNFLSGRLPFEDNSFDHVHVYRIAWGVGEMQWDGLFEEIARVLRPGGAVEIAEEDILFPRLPRSYTIKGKQPRPAAPYPRPSLTLSPPPSPVDVASSQHAHALLESLYFGVFESRMINLCPTSIIPHHLNIHFRNVLSTSYVDTPFPPAPKSRRHLRHIRSDCTERPKRRESDASSSSHFSSASSLDSSDDQQQQTPPATSSSFSSLSDSNIPPPEPVQAESTIETLAPAPPPLKQTQVFGRFGQSATNTSLLPPVEVDINERSLCLWLNTAYQRIIACKEAMWDELRRRLLLRREGGPDLLRAFGWDDDEEHDNAGDSSDSGHGHGHGEGPTSGLTKELERARARFDEMTQRFERDLRYRTAIADAVELALGWKRPPPAPMSKHERARAAELDKAIAEAARLELAEPEQKQVSRSFKGFVGFKEGAK